MRIVLIATFFLTALLNCHSQMKYSDLMDLITLCKKEDFKAVKFYLENERLSIDVFKTNYDHGSYFVLAEIKAFYPSDNGLKNKIEIDFKEYDYYKELTVEQNILTDNEYKIHLYRVEPIWYWASDSWTTAYFSKNSKKNEEVLGKRMWDFSRVDSLQEKISNQKLRELISSEEFESNENGYSGFFVNSNPTFGDLKYNILTYQALPGKYFDCTLFLTTKFLKGKNVENINNKTLVSPLIKNDKVYTLHIKFGNLIKTYILDSGASDMSIDDEIFEYLENSGQLKIENRLTDSKYQLADGSIVQFKRVKIPGFSINEIAIKNIDATIIENGKPLLLGKSFLDSFKSWKIDNEKQVLIVELF